MGNIPFVGVPRNQSEHTWLLSTDHQTWQGIGPWFTRSIDHAIMFPFHRGSGLGPERFENSQRLFQLLYSYPRCWIRKTISIVLFLMPTCTNTKDEASFTHILSSGRHFRQQGGIAKRLSKHHIPKVKRGITCRHVGQGRPALQDRRILELQMIDIPDRVEVPGDYLQTLADPFEVDFTCHTSER